MEDPQNPNDIPWEKLSPAQAERTASKLASVSVWRFAALTLVAVGLALQPILNAYYQNENDARNVDIQLNKSQSESALALSTSAISQITELSAKLGELRNENTSLKETLKVLTEKYNQLLVSYTAALSEKKEMEQRIDQLFKINSEKK